MDIIKTPRLILRPLNKTDYQNWHDAYSGLGPARNPYDEGALKEKYLSRKIFNELLKTQAQERKLDQAYAFGVFDRNDGVLIGIVRLMDISRGIFQNAYLGYRIFHHYWGQGFATEACLAVIKYAFKNYRLHRIEAGIHPSNKASIKVAKKMKMRFEGVSKKRLIWQGRWTDMRIYALTKEDLKSSPR